MQHINEVLNRYIFVLGEDVYFDKVSGKNVNEGVLVQKLAKSTSLDKITKLLDGLKEHGKPRSKLTKPKMTIQFALSQSYKTLAEHINLRRFSSKGIPSLFTIDAQNQVTYCGDADKHKFADLLLSDETTIEKLSSEYEDGPYSGLYATKLNFKAFIEALYDQFYCDRSKAIFKRPKAISWDPDVPAFRMLNPKLLQDGPTPNWDSFLARMDFPETFMAYVWSSFDPDNKGRQCIWMRGEGLDGKSSAMNAVAAFLGREYVLSVTKNSYNKDFFYGSAYGKRIAIYMDCKNLQLLRTEAIKSMLGNDTVDVNKKFEHSFSSQIHAKLFVGSNFFPEINFHDNSERSRLLLVQIKSYEDKYGDSDFEANLEEEMPNFLFKCKQVYESNCPKRNNIKVPADMLKNIELLCAAEEADAIMRFVAEKLEFDPEFKEESYVLRQVLTEYLQRNNIDTRRTFSHADFSRVLLRRGAVAMTNGHKKYFSGVRIKKT